MSDDDLIRRGDVREALRDVDLWTMVTSNVIHRLPAAQTFTAADLSDPITVHANMLRGSIAKPTVEQIIHLYGVDALVKALAPVILREANAVERPTMRSVMVDPEEIPDMEMEYDHRAGDENDD